ncbi:class I SAM-dependent methyltransferase [Streptomyces sp. NBC_00237]|uniref:class I SAM-dependent methyltransferase n=1 Tax=Streptomyces sp. NBC_00237 TaxID=2975687 RepID=UPI00225C1798|nr:class I SAM-dependent methyltransferase [Streptomyces sp. NBC_00237]MCX5204597.1 class I SAM-dependent methyltransferase [Streptomyces sp. NBC_00237]
MDRSIRTVDDVMHLLDGLFAPEADRWTDTASDWWDGFYADRDRPVPFFVSKPDENLVSYLERGMLRPDGRALDLGCGPGRNALHLAAAGYEVDAVDLSPTAVAWAGERAAEAAPEVRGRLRFRQGDVFALAADALPGPYDLIHDSGCFHHLPPHRRIGYLALIGRLLAPGGHFSLACFAAGEDGMGCEIPDGELYGAAAPQLHGGLAYTSESLRRIFSSLDEVELRRMRDESAASDRFGEPFLWAGLFRRHHC